MDRGYIKLWRSIEQNELLENDNTAFVVFLKLLTRVDRRTGSFTTGRKKLAAICNLNPNTLYSALKRLEASTIIQQHSNSSSTTISICNWWKYQQDDNKSSSERQLVINTKQEKKKKENNIYSDRDVLGILNRITGRKFKVEPLGIEKTKKLFSDEEIEKALRNMQRDAWHKDKMRSLKPEYLLRATTIDNFLEKKSDVENYFERNKLVTRPASRLPDASNRTRAEILSNEYA